MKNKKICFNHTTACRNLNIALILLVAMLHLQCAKPKGTVQRDAPMQSADTVNGIKFKYLLGINGFEWEFSGADNEVSDAKTALIKPFGGFRHYLDWSRLETAENSYAFQPSLSGLWRYDDIYQWCKSNDIPVLACIKTIPDWLRDTYPPDERDEENAPLPYGLDRLAPASYMQFAKLGFQFAARYGRNKQVDTSLVFITPEPHWEPNQKKVGLGLIRYIECNNEPDRTWKGRNPHQTPEEYAANLSAFYDGHLGTLGPGIGVKNADSEMQVVMGGLAEGDPDYIGRMIDWCKQNRGLHPDGTINLCFDVINYHHYSFSEQGIFGKNARGVAPEKSTAAQTARQIVRLAEEKTTGLEVWVTELGYDVHQESPLRAIPIKEKSPLVTQADWLLRSSLLYARNGVKRLFFYMLNDADFYSEVQFASSGFIDGEGRRPAADFFMQAKNLIGDYFYFGTINEDPIVDVYELNGKRMYVLLVPDEKGREIDYELKIPNVDMARIHYLQAGKEKTVSTDSAISDGKLMIRVTETPVFVEAL
ncbi:hypothetical protein [Parapedobacter sp. DT-150]|uniref:hypothetical protein n=1 Tax=Parapedobacter sp. DT-150 TaxID=3396162 RepID=UPI003F1B6746